MLLRTLTRDDFGLLGTWLREPLVATWWHDDPDPEALERQYGPAIDGTDPAVLRIGELQVPGGGFAVGFVQWYRLADEPEYRAELAAVLPVPDDAWSLDYLVGAPAQRGRGVGSALVRAALDAIGPAPVIVAVHAENGASAGVLRGTGFRVVTAAELEPDNPAHSRAHLVLLREAGERGGPRTTTDRG